MTTYFPANYRSKCNECGGDIARGEDIGKSDEGYAHKKCLEEAKPSQFEGTTLEEMGY